MQVNISPGSRHQPDGGRRRMMHNPDFTPRRAKKPGFINLISTIV